MQAPHARWGRNWPELAGIRGLSTFPAEAGASAARRRSMPMRGTTPLPRDATEGPTPMQGPLPARTTGSFSVAELAGDYSGSRYAFARRLGEAAGPISADNWREVQPIF